MGEMNELMEWYNRQCDGDWEHQYGVHIETLDNPGWLLKVDLVETALEGEKFDLGVDMASSDVWLRHQRWDLLPGGMCTAIATARCS